MEAELNSEMTCFKKFSNKARGRLRSRMQTGISGVTLEKREQSGLYFRYPKGSGLNTLLNLIISRIPSTWSSDNLPLYHMLKFIQDLCTIGPKKCQSSENHNPNSEEQDHRALTLRGISREGIDKHLAQRNHLGPRSQQTKKG